MNKTKQIVLLFLTVSFSLVSYGQGQAQEQAQEQAAAQEPVREQIRTEVSRTKNGVIQLEDTIRGSREQPKVLSIVPWQPPKDKEQLPSPFVKRIEQDFLPLDREEFRRRVQHFDKVSDK